MIKTPVNQKRQTNISVVRLKKGGKKFEIACYPNKVLSYRSKIDTDLDEVMQTRSVYTNVSKGEVAKKDDLLKVFRTENVDEIIIQILEKGELQVSTKEREQMLESSLKEIVTIVVTKCINPDTKKPYTPSMIEQALKELHYAVNPNKTPKQQALEAIKKLQKEIPISRAQMRLRISINSNDARKLKTLFQTNDATKIEKEEFADKTLKFVVLIDPGMFREVDDYVTSKKGESEVLDACVVEEGDVKLGEEGEEEEAAPEEAEEEEASSKKSKKKKNQEVEEDEDDGSSKKKKKNKKKGGDDDEEKPKSDEEADGSFQVKKNKKKKSKKHVEEEPAEEAAPAEEEPAPEEDEDSGKKKKKKKKQVVEEEAPVEEEPAPEEEDSGKKKKKKKKQLEEEAPAEEPEEEDAGKKKKKKKKQIEEEEPAAEEEPEETGKKKKKKKQAEEEDKPAEEEDEDLSKFKKKKKKMLVMADDDEPAPEEEEDSGKKKKKKKAAEEAPAPAPVKANKWMLSKNDDEDEKPAAAPKKVVVAKWLKKGDDAADKKKKKKAAEAEETNEGEEGEKETYDAFGDAGSDDEKRFKGATKIEEDELGDDPLSQKLAKNLGQKNKDKERAFNRQNDRNKKQNRRMEYHNFE